MFQLVQLVPGSKGNDTIHRIHLWMHDAYLCRLEHMRGCTLM